MTNKKKFYKIEYVDKKGKPQVKSLFAGSTEMAREKFKLENEDSKIKSLKELGSIDELKENLNNPEIKS